MHLLQILMVDQVTKMEFISIILRALSQYRPSSDDFWVRSPYFDGKFSNVKLYSSPKRVGFWLINRSVISFCQKYGGKKFFGQTKTEKSKRATNRCIFIIKPIRRKSFVIKVHKGLINDERCCSFLYFRRIFNEIPLETFFFFDEYDFRAKGMSEIVQASSGIIYAPLKSSDVRVLSFTAYDVFQILFSCDLGVKSLSKSKTIRFSSRIAHFCGIFFSDFHIVKS